MGLRNAANNTFNWQHGMMGKLQSNQPNFYSIFNRA